MFLEYFNLLEQPFGVTPDTRFLYMNHMYCEALASLWYGLKEHRGFMALVSEPGMGKTTLLFQLLQRLRVNNAVRTVFLFQTCCNSRDLIRYLLQDMGILPASHLPSMHQQLNEALLREARLGRELVFVIDEAQNLSESVLETIRLLSDFETPQGKLLQIVLAGQPQLIQRLMKPELLQLTQRISVVKFLDPLAPPEVDKYVRHRLGVAGYKGKPLFTSDALQRLVQESHGIPRNINNICFGALTTAVALGRRQVNLEIIEEVSADQNLKLLRQRVASRYSETSSADGGLLDTAAALTATSVVSQPLAAGSMRNLEISPDEGGPLEPAVTSPAKSDVSQPLLGGSIARCVHSAGHLTRSLLKKAAVHLGAFRELRDWSRGRIAVTHWKTPASTQKPESVLTIGE